MSCLKNITSVVLGASLLLCAQRMEAQTPGQSVFAIDDRDPVSSVPSPQQAQQMPLEMGYFVMELSDRAQAAEQRGDHAAAAQYYRAMAKAVPDRATGYSKACAAHAKAKHWDAALEVCRVALATEGVTVADLSRFVSVMLQREQLPNAQDLEEIDVVLKQLEASAPKTAQAKLELAQLRCQVAVRVEEIPRLRACTAAMTQLAPKAPQTSIYALTLALKQGDVAQAERIVERARDHGMAPAALKHMSDIIAARRPLQSASTLQRAPRTLWLVLSLCAFALFVALITHRIRRNHLRA